MWAGIFTVNGFEGDFLMCFRAFYTIFLTCEPIVFAEVHPQHKWEMVVEPLAKESCASLNSNVHKRDFCSSFVHRFSQHFFCLHSDQMEIFSSSHHCSYNSFGSYFRAGSSPLAQTLCPCVTLSFRATDKSHPPYPAGAFISSIFHLILHNISGD